MTEEERGREGGQKGGEGGEEGLGVLTNTHTRIMNILLARLDERLIDVEDILWQRAAKRDKMREGGTRGGGGGSDDEH